MNNNDSRDAAATTREILPLERLLTEYERRTNEPDFEDMEIHVDPADTCPPSRRSDRDLERVLAILDEIQVKGGNQ